MCKKNTIAALTLFFLLPTLACGAPQDDKKEKEKKQSQTVSPPAAVHAKVKKAEIPGIVNFSRIDGTEGFGGATAGFGGATEPSAMAELKKNGFATVINLRLATEPGAEIAVSRTAAEAAGLKYIHLPFDPENPADLVGDFLAAMSNKANEPVYIHCHSATRAAALWMIGRVLKDGRSLDEAGEEATAIAAKPSEAVAFAGAYIESQKR